MISSAIRLHGHWKALVLLIAVSVSFLLLGWYGRKLILESNKCEMTYGTKAKAEVIVEKYKGNYELYKVSNAESKKLGKYAVLFIPGHFGRYVSLLFLHNS
ncbi:hypothetical protein EON65_09155 [archaeon]|nr:MAG: hypothetical protein EON65_09155 [archaeon]